MKKPVLSGVYRAFYSKRFYREVARDWTSESFLYPAWLLCLAGLVYGSLLVYHYQRTFKPMAEELIRQIPRIHFVSGKAAAEGPQPLSLHWRMQGRDQVIAVIDTSDHFKSIEETGAPMWLNSREFVVLSKGEKRIRSLSQFKESAIDADWVRDKAKWIFKIGLLIAVPVFFVLLYGYQLLAAVFYALMGLLSNAFFGAKLSFEKLWRLALVAMTPAFLLRTATPFLPHKLPRPGLTAFFLTLFYVSFAVWANIPEDDST